jgi:NadR type nicotinamide-nucleotide adenylyltransferase
MEKSSVLKIAIVGAESSGKTWLCEALADHYQTLWVPEYAREYFNHSDIYNYTLNDLEIIAKKQLELEGELLLKANRFLFCDTSLITLKIWAELEFGSTPEFIAEQLENTHYDLYLLTDNQIPWVEDAQRQNKHNRQLLFNLNLYEIKRSRIPFAVISGKEMERLQNAIIKINALL